VISAEPHAGTLPPCNLILRELPDGGVAVSFMDPVTVLDLTANPAIQVVGEEARQRLQRVMERLNAQ